MLCIYIYQSYIEAVLRDTCLHVTTCVLFSIFSMSPDPELEGNHLKGSPSLSHPPASIDPAEPGMVEKIQRIFVQLMTVTGSILAWCSFCYLSTVNCREDENL